MNVLLVDEPIPKSVFHSEPCRKDRGTTTDGT